jgi:hypothetical protein
MHKPGTGLYLYRIIIAVYLNVTHAGGIQDKFIGTGRITFIVMPAGANSQFYPVLFGPFNSMGYIARVIAIHNRAGIFIDCLVIFLTGALVFAITRQDNLSG